MNKILLLSSLALAAVSSALAQNSLNDDPVGIFSADADVSVAVGMSREGVNFMLGVPSETLGSQVWIYSNFRGKGASGAEKLDTLLVVFTGGRVTALRLAGAKPVAAMVAKSKAAKTAAVGVKTIPGFIPS